MSRMTYVGVIGGLLLMVGMIHGMAERPTDRNLPAEFQVLEQYIGAWSVAITPADQLASGTANAEWILDGCFVQQSSELLSADGTKRVKFHIMMTYDPMRKKYRRWAFVSDGITSESEGTWDAATRQMTWVNRNSEIGSTMTVTEDFSVANTESWRMVNTDRGGAVLFERGGKNTRQR